MTEQYPDWLITEFAPLPAAFIKHVYEHPQSLRREENTTIWSLCQQARMLAAYYLSPFAGAERIDPRERLSPDWLRKNFYVFDREKKTPSRQAVSDWQSRNLLRSSGFARLEISSVAALVAMRYMFHVPKYWLPSSQGKADPWFSVICIEPGCKVSVQPYPHVRSAVPANSLLMTSWPGAEQMPGWKGVLNKGAIAWAGVTRMGQDFWNLTIPEMEAWGAQLDSHLERVELLGKAVYPGHLAKQRGDVERYYRLTRLHTAADLLLEQVGEPLFHDYLSHYYSSELPPDSMYQCNREGQ